MDPLRAWLIKAKGILKRKLSPDSPDSSFPWNFIGVSCVSKYIWGVNIKNILLGPKEQKKKKKTKAMVSTLKKRKV